MGKIWVSRHAQRRYAERVLKVKNSHQFLKDKKNYLKCVKGVLNLYYKSEYMGEGYLSKHHFDKSSYYVSDPYMIVVDEELNKIVTVYKVKSLVGRWYG